LLYLSKIFVLSDLNWLDLYPIFVVQKNASRQSIIAGGDLTEDSTGGLHTYGSIQANKPFDPVSGVALSSSARTRSGGAPPTETEIHLEDTNPLLDKINRLDEDSPFDTDAYRRRERHSTFHGFGKPNRPDHAELIKSEQTPSNKDPLLRRQASNPTESDRPKSRSSSMAQLNPAAVDHSLPDLVPKIGPTNSYSQHLNDPLSRSMDVFPREIMINPEYRTLFDAATRHIRLLSQKKKQEEQGTDIPAVTQIPPSSSSNHASRDDEFESGSENWEYDGGYSPSSVGSEKEFLRNNKNT